MPWTRTTLHVKYSDYQHNTQSFIVPMASQRRVLGFILTFSLALVCLISQADHASANSIEPDHFSKISSENDSENRVNLSVYYESLCPYCANFIVNNLVKIFQTDLINIVNLRLVPWGNTQIQPNDTWICQVPCFPLYLPTPFAITMALF